MRKFCVPLMRIPCANGFAHARWEAGSLKSTVSTEGAFDPYALGNLLMINWKADVWGSLLCMLGLLGLSLLSPASPSEGNYE